MIATLIGGALVFVGVVTGMFAITLPVRKREQPSVVNLTSHPPKVKHSYTQVTNQLNDSPRIDEDVNKQAITKMTDLHVLLLAQDDEISKEVGDQIDEIVIDVLELLKKD